jgi:hypothetical protein
MERWQTELGGTVGGTAGSRPARSTICPKGEKTKKRKKDCPMYDRAMAKHFRREVEID